MCNDTMIDSIGHELKAINHIMQRKMFQTAADAGIEKGDIITEFNGTAVTGYMVFNSEKMKYSPGDEVTLTVYRGGKTYSVKITLGTANS